MIHAYYGDGKGKTTAAMGLALRSLAAGWRVCAVQFLKDGASGEVRLLWRHPGMVVLAGKACGKFASRMDEGELAATRALHDAHLDRALALARAGEVRLVVLDEAFGALSRGLADERAVRALMEWGAADGELVLTGRELPPFVEEAADYLTEMRCVRHPFDRGVAAREGVEY